MKTIYYCEKCGKSYTDSDACLEHENSCDNMVTFMCHKCGKIETWYDNDRDSLVKKNSCHTVNLGYMGYGSKLDGKCIVFDICDDCLICMIDGLRYKDDVLERKPESWIW